MHINPRMNLFTLTILALSLPTQAMDVNFINYLHHRQSTILDSTKEEPTKHKKPLCSNPKDVKLCEPSVKRQLAFKAQMSKIDLCKDVDLKKNPSCAQYRTKSKYVQLLEWSKAYPKYKSYHPEYCDCLRY